MRMPTTTTHDRLDLLQCLRDYDKDMRQFAADVAEEQHNAGGESLRMRTFCLLPLDGLAVEEVCVG